MVTDIYSLKHEPFSFDGRGGGYIAFECKLLASLPALIGVIKSI